MQTGQAKAVAGIQYGLATMLICTLVISIMLWGNLRCGELHIMEDPPYHQSRELVDALARFIERGRKSTSSEDRIILERYGFSADFDNVFARQGSRIILTRRRIIEQNFGWPMSVFVKRIVQEQDVYPFDEYPEFHPTRLQESVVWNWSGLIANSLATLMTLLVVCRVAARPTVKD